MFVILLCIAASLTPCERELQSGRYINGIAAQFQTSQSGAGAIIPNQNIVCYCARTPDRSPVWMICAIALTDDHVADVVTQRLGSEDEADLLPFYLFQDHLHHQLPPVVYVDPACDPPVYAEILCFPDGILDSFGYEFLERHNFFPTNEGPLKGPTEVSPVRRVKSLPPRHSIIEITNAIRRASSSPPRLNYPRKSMSMTQCTGGSNQTVCPITLSPFIASQVVYVLKEDVQKLIEGKSVPCFSAEGLMQLKKKHSLEGFKDPLRRTDRVLRIHDFEAYVVAEDGCAEDFSKMKLDESPKKQRSSQAGPSNPDEDKLATSNNIRTNKAFFMLFPISLLFWMSRQFTCQSFFHKDNHSAELPLL